MRGVCGGIDGVLDQRCRRFKNRVVDIFSRRRISMWRKVRKIEVKDGAEKDERDKQKGQERGRVAA